MTTHTVTIPTEPRDRTVVLDAEGHAWQRTGDVWWCVGRYEATRQLIGQTRRTWPHLIVDFGPLTELQPRPEAAFITGQRTGELKRPVRDNPQA